MAKQEKPDVPKDAEEKLAQLVERASAMARKIRRVQTRKEMQLAPLGNKLKQIEDAYRVRLERLARRREEVIRQAVELWDEHYPGQKSVRLPAGIASRLEYITLEVVDARAVVDALGRLDRLDLADHVFDLRGLAQLYRKGELQPRMADGAVRVLKTERLILRPAKSEFCDRRFSCKVECPLDSTPGSGQGMADGAASTPPQRPAQAGA